MIRVGLVVVLVLVLVLVLVGSREVELIWWRVVVVRLRKAQGRSCMSIIRSIR